MLNSTLNSDWKQVGDSDLSDINLDHEFVAYDISSINYPLELKILPMWEIILKITVTVILMLLAIVGNTMVILVVIWNKRLRTTTNFFIMNLSVADLFVTFSCTWVLLVDNLTNGWRLGSFFCKVNSFAQVASLSSSVLSMVLISIDRFFGIVFAIRAHIVERRARYCIVLVWLCAIAVAIPQLIYRKVFVRHWKNYDEIWCDEEWELQKSRVIYWTTVSILLFVLPSLVMIVTYGCIIRTLWLSQPPGERIIYERNTQDGIKKKMLTLVYLCLDSVCSLTKLLEFSRTIEILLHFWYIKLWVVVMLITIVIVFWICWVPVQFSILYSEYRTNKHEIIGDWYVDFNYWIRVLAFANSAINPIVYAAFSDSFRQGFQRFYRRSNRKPTNRTDQICSHLSTSNHRCSRCSTRANINCSHRSSSSSRFSMKYTFEPLNGKGSHKNTDV